ncbi:MAG: hypothetical protein P8P83_04140 [Rickettsiaceae bacterium]|nr:hypothetical protein [Rickettsiaceae bacterium]
MPRRIEHRLASANANPLHVIYSMLLAIEKGLDDPDQIDVCQKIFGNASDPQYVLRKIT